MYVIKRDGSKVHASFDEISTRIRKLCQERGLPTLEDEKDVTGINVELLAQKTIAALPHEKDRIIRTSEIDALSADIAEMMTLEYGYMYHQLAGYLLVSNLQKETPPTFSEATEQLEHLLARNYLEFVERHADALNELVRNEQDYVYDYFGFQTLRKGYLLRDIKGKTVERPQYMHMRVAVTLWLPQWQEDVLTAISEISKSYRLFSEMCYTHASPTLFNAGKPAGNLGSCFLQEIAEDSLDSIYTTLYDSAMISKASGGIGVAISRVRAKGASIKSSGGKADGIVPMLRNFDATAVYVNQSGARKGAISVYLEPWHADIHDFLELKTNEGDEAQKCRNLFTALWVPDLFMKRVEANGKWSLFSPDDTPELVDLYGDDFEDMYEQYEASGKAKKVVQAQTLWFAIIKSQIETGVPYMLYKDACNIKSNQKNLGTIKSSNLCTEVVEYASKTQIANCNLASISLPYCVVDGKFDFEELRDICEAVVCNLNRVIDKTEYPLHKCRTSNFAHRPLGIGVQGLADVFMMMGLPYDSPEARALNRKIFEHIYYACIWMSIDLAEEHGTYESYEGSPASQGILQPDMWNIPRDSRDPDLDWDLLYARLKHHGLRNSLLIAPMPTASTSSIMGNIESFEPQTSNLYVRRTQTGEYLNLNKHLVKELEERGLWRPEIIQQIQKDKGSVQRIDELPEKVRKVFKTVWDVSPIALIDMSADRAPFICQSQSFNAFMKNVSYEKVSAYHFHGWKKGLKTGMYYLRTQNSFDAVNISVAPITAPDVCRRDNPNCVACSS